MQITVNGLAQNLSLGMNVTQLLEQLKIAPERVAVELNLTVISPEAYHATTLNDQDQVEIISFIGGGEYGI